LWSSIGDAADIAVIVT